MSRETSHEMSRETPHELSQRELEVLRAAAAGLTNGQIAVALNVTRHAVKFHLSSIYRKLGVANRTEAAVVLVATAGLADDTVMRHGA